MHFSEPLSSPLALLTLFDGPGTNGRRYRGGRRYGGGKAGPACGVLFVVVMGGDWGHFGGVECVS